MRRIRVGSFNRIRSVSWEAPTCMPTRTTIRSASSIRPANFSGPRFFSELAGDYLLGARFSPLIISASLGGSWSRRDQPLEDQPLADRHLADRHLADRPLEDRRLGARHLADRRLADRRVVVRRLLVPP